VEEVVPSKTPTDEAVDQAFKELYKLFSAPLKNEKRHRRYDLTFENGQPVFVRSEFDRMLDEIIGPESGLEP
jgi:hypothetical protein